MRDEVAGFVVRPVRRSGVSCPVGVGLPQGTPDHRGFAIACCVAAAIATAAAEARPCEQVYWQS